MGVANVSQIYVDWVQGRKHLFGMGVTNMS